MEEWVFKKIIDELAEIKYKDILAPHFYGEPLLDKRLLNFITYAHQKLPRATIKIVSNGDFMSVEKYLALVKAGVRKFIVTQHSPEMSTNMIKLLTFFGKNPKNIPQKNFLKRYEDIGEKTVEVSFDYQILDLFYNRGGLIKLEDVEGYGELDVNPLPICFYHSNPLVITYNGDIPLCCQDYNSEVVFGNVKEQSLMEIWKSPRFTAMRKKLSKRQYDLPMCKTCVGQTT
jgi:radical SAM protein with 4Fe4S-binding SPASM domain